MEITIEEFQLIFDWWRSSNRYYGDTLQQEKPDERVIQEIKLISKLQKNAKETQ